MKFIKKGGEPNSFTEWKKKPGNLTRSWKSFRRTIVKEQLLQALLEEQGYICCYCGISITKDNCHIEHFQPQSLDENLRFDYNNLMVSCQGEDEDNPPVPVHCGHKKDNWFDKSLLVSPLIENCTDFFKYPASGEILPTDDTEKKDAAETTIENLALDIKKLRKMRKSVIEAELAGIEDLSKADVEKLIQAYQKPDANGQYIPFYAALIYILQNY